MNNMSTVKVYILKENSPIKYACKIIEKCYDSGYRVKVLTKDCFVDEIDKELWIFKQLSFIPHGTSNDESPFIQPVYISHTDEVPNKADTIVMYMMDEYDIEKLGKLFERVIVIDTRDYAQIPLNSSVSEVYVQLDEGNFTQLDNQ